MTSSRNVTTITINRDYRDVITKFEMQPFPEELSRNGISLLEFENTINEINRLLQRAETVDSRSIFEECIGCLTFFSIFLFYDDKYKKCIKRITEFIERENETLYNPKGITWVNPVSNGFLKIDIIIRLSNSNQPSQQTTPSTIPTSLFSSPPVNNNNNEINNNNNSNNNNNKDNNNNDKQSTTTFRTPTKLPEFDDRFIQKPETIINVNTNSNIVELSDDEEDDDDDGSDGNDNNNNNNNSNINSNNNDKNGMGSSNNV